MPTIYCDEAGNTGEKLLDSDQPHFVLASNDYSIEEAEALLLHVASPQGGEPKFTTLKKTGAGVQRLTKLISDPRLNETRIVIVVFHKKYLVYTKLVDLITETVMHEMGHDLYKDGANIAMANLLYFCTPTFCGLEETNEMLEAFIDMIRFKESKHIEGYFQAGNKLLKACKDQEFQETLNPFFSRHVFPIWFPSIGKLALEPAVPALFNQIVEWGRRKSERFEVIHDQSKPVLASEEIFRRMLAGPEEISKTVGYDRRKFQFPLRANSLAQGDSKIHPQIQLADTCAGLIAHYLKMRSLGKSDEIVTLVEQMNCLKWVVNAVLPSQDITPEQLGTNSGGGSNPIDPFVDRQ